MVDTPDDTFAVVAGDAGPDHTPGYDHPLANIAEVNDDLVYNENDNIKEKDNIDANIRNDYYETT
jgi:hypothetical protein